MSEELAQYAASVGGISAAQSPMTPGHQTSPVLYGSGSPPLGVVPGRAVYTGSPVRNGYGSPAPTGGTVYYGGGGIPRQYGY
jgi:hypothetical protein